MPSDEEFADYRLEGERFNAPGLPVETARELGYYRETILAVAKKLWLRSNLDSTIVPKGFADGFDLRLTEVKRGSARPQLYLHQNSEADEDKWADWRGFYFQARDVVTQTINTVGAEGVLPNAFPKEALQPLKQMGRALGDDEAIVVGPTRFQGRKAKLTKDINTAIRSIAEVVDEEDFEVEVKGVIYAFDSKERSFLLRDEYSRAVRCFVDRGYEHFMRQAKDACATDEMNAPDVQVRGTAPRGGVVRTLAGVTNIELVRSVSEKMASRKLDALSQLGDGWGGPATAAVSMNAIAQIRAILTELTSIVPSVAIASEDDGSVVLEWRRDATEYTAVLSDELALFECTDNVETDELREATVTFEPNELLRFIRTGEIA